MRIFVLSRTDLLGRSTILGLFSELEWAKAAAQKRVEMFTWETVGDDRLVYISRFVGPRPSYIIESYEVDPDPEEVDSADDRTVPASEEGS